MKLSDNSIYLKYILFKFKIYFSILFGKKIYFLNKLNITIKKKNYLKFFLFEVFLLFKNNNLNKF